MEILAEMVIVGVMNDRQMVFTDKFEKARGGRRGKRTIKRKYACGMGDCEVQDDEGKKGKFVCNRWGHFGRS